MKPPTKTAAKKTPAKKTAPPSDADQIKALLARSTPAEQKAILSVIERTTEIMAETNVYLQSVIKSQGELGRLRQLMGGLRALQASGATR